VSLTKLSAAAPAVGACCNIALLRLTFRPKPGRNLP
jgi:hypothetical protein